MLVLKGTAPVRTNCWAISSLIFPPPFVSLCLSMVASLHSRAVPLRAVIPKFGTCPACGGCAGVPAPALWPWTCAHGTWARRKVRRGTFIANVPGGSFRQGSILGPAASVSPLPWRGPSPQTRAPERRFCGSSKNSTRPRGPAIFGGALRRLGARRSSRLRALGLAPGRRWPRRGPGFPRRAPIPKLARSYLNACRQDYSATALAAAVQAGSCFLKGAGTVERAARALNQERLELLGNHLHLACSLPQRDGLGRCPQPKRDRAGQGGCQKPWLCETTRRSSCKDAAY